jgi:hypothetical protein
MVGCASSVCAVSGCKLRSLSASDLWRRELLVPQLKLVILNVTEGGVKDLLYLPFDIGAKRRSANSTL